MTLGEKKNTLTLIIGEYCILWILIYFSTSVVPVQCIDISVVQICVKWLREACIRMSCVVPLVYRLLDSKSLCPKSSGYWMQSSLGPAGRWSIWNILQGMEGEFVSQLQQLYQWQLELGCQWPVSALHTIPTPVHWCQQELPDLLTGGGQHWGGREHPLPVWGPYSPETEGRSDKWF